MSYQEQDSLNSAVTPDILIPRGNGILIFGKADYRVSERAERDLNNRVTEIEQSRFAKFNGRVDFEDDKPLINRSILVASLPPGLSEDEFVNRVLLLSYHSESATDSYAQVIYDSGRRYKASSWLNRFTEKIWVPDEYQHADPFKRALLEFGYSEEELDRQAKETKGKIYEHTSGDTPVQMTMFGMIQEEITDVWHGLAGFLLKKASPRLAEYILKVKQRETLHKRWYKDLTAIQVADNPDLRHQAADAIARFKMPGHKVVPQLQEGSPDLILVMGGDLRKLEQGLVRLISESLDNNTEYLGEAILELASRNSHEAGVTFVKLARGASRIPGVGRVVNLLAGQAVQEREGMKPKTPAEKKVWDITTPIRSLIVRKAEDLSFVA